jgi:hypothetical protein
VLTNYCFDLTKSHVSLLYGPTESPPSVIGGPRDALRYPGFGPACKFGQIGFTGSDAFFTALACSPFALSHLGLLGKLFFRLVDGEKRPQLERLPLGIGESEAPA